MSRPEDDVPRTPEEEGAPASRRHDGRPLREAIKNPQYAQSPEQMAQLVRAISNEPAQARPSPWEPDDPRGAIAVRPIYTIEEQSPPREEAVSPGSLPPTTIRPIERAELESRHVRVRAELPQEPGATPHEPERRALLNRQRVALVFAALAVVLLFFLLRSSMQSSASPPSAASVPTASSVSSPVAPSTLPLPASVPARADDVRLTPPPAAAPAPAPHVPPARSRPEVHRDPAPPASSTPKPPNVLQDTFE